MALLQRRRIVLAKIETTYGVDAAPTGGANAILVRNLDVTPLDADLVNRDVVRPFLGSQGQLIAGQKVTVSMEVELAGSGTAGSAPAYGPLLRACGLAEVLTAAAVTGSATAGSTTSITLAAGASSVDGAYNGMSISLTSGTGSGQTGTIIGYVGSTKVATVAVPWTTSPAAATGYSISANVVYRPISSGFESITLYAQLQDSTAANSPQHKITGCRGTFELGMTAKQIPALKFTFTGIYNAVADASNISAPVYTGFKVPLPVNKQNTPVFNVFGFPGIASEFSVNMTNDVIYRNLIGSESVLITNRDAKGSMTFEAPTITSKDFFSAATAAGVDGAFSATHGTVAGNIIDISAPNMNVLNPAYSEMDGVVMMQLPYEFVAANGGDDFYLCIR
jgi:hypothetical protein